MSSLIKIAGFSPINEKGNQSIRVQVSNGFALDPKPKFILSTPDIIKEYKLTKGMNITDMCAGFEVQLSKVTDRETGEELTFEFLVPPRDNSQSKSPI